MLSFLVASHVTELICTEEQLLNEKKKAKKYINILNQDISQCIPLGMNFFFWKLVFTTIIHIHVFR